MCGLKKKTPLFILVIITANGLYVLRMLMGNYFRSVQFSSVRDGIYALGKAHMRSTPTLRLSFLNMLLLPKQFQC